MRFSIEMFAPAGFILWALSERGFQILRQHQTGKSAHQSDLWLISTTWYAAVLFSIFDAFNLHWTAFPESAVFLQWLGAPLIAAGLVIRLLARKELGRQFSVHVQTSDAHQLIETGLYSSIRHPAYLGLLLLYLGIPLCAGSLLGTAIAVLGGFPAVINRINAEEKALLEWFGEKYQQLQQRTARLIPGIW